MTRTYLIHFKRFSYGFPKMRTVKGMTQKAKDIVKAVLKKWRAGESYDMASANVLLQLCQELEGKL